MHPTSSHRHDVDGAVSPPTRLEMASHSSDPRRTGPLLTADGQAFENTSTNVAAAQMRNHLTSLAESVDDPEKKKVSKTTGLACPALA